MDGGQGKPSGDGRSLPDHPRRRRRWLQFSLRSFLVLTTGAAIALSWYYQRFRQPRPTGCVDASRPATAVWIATPDQDEIIARFVQQHPEYAGRESSLRTVRKKVIDQLQPPRYIPFAGQVRLHRVRITADVYGDLETPLATIPFDYDHYHVDTSEPEPPLSK